MNRSLPRLAAIAGLFAVTLTGCNISNQDQQAAIDACVRAKGGDASNREYLRQVCANELQQQRQAHGLEVTVGGFELPLSGAAE